jgi:hypothetical protein
MKIMKAYLKTAYLKAAYLMNLKTATGQVLCNLYEPTGKSFQIAGGFNLKMRVATLLVLTGLIMPVIFIGEWQTASAASIAPPTSLSAPIAAPPEPFILSSSNTLSGSVSTTIATSVSSVSNLVVRGHSYAAGFFNTPPVPEGLSPELAKPVSPFSAAVSSIESSVDSAYNLIVPTAKAESTAAAVLTTPGASSVSFDFDGDGYADAARWQPATGEWKIKNSIGNNITTVQVGAAGDKIVPADYDADGKTDAAAWRPSTGVWTIRRSSTNQTVTVQFGMTGDIPRPGDYDGNGSTEVAVFRPSEGNWYIKNASGGANVIQFGMAGDIPVAGDYDGNGSTDLAVYRPAGGVWFIRSASGGYNSVQWGMSSDIPVPADYDGDGKTDIAVYRPSGGTWFVSHSNGTPYTVTNWGNYGDQPVPADYDADGKADVAVWRPVTGKWFVIQTSNNNTAAHTVGAPGDWAVTSAYVKQSGAEVYSYDFARTRLSPKNQMGGTNLYSRKLLVGRGAG